MRLVVRERYFEGRSAAEVARAHGIPAGTVRWRLEVGLDRLRDQLDARYEPSTASMSANAGGTSTATAKGWTAMGMLSLEFVVGAAAPGAVGIAAVAVGGATRRRISPAFPLPIAVAQSFWGTAQPPGEQPRTSKPARMPEYGDAASVKYGERVSIGAP